MRHGELADNSLFGSNEFPFNLLRELAAKGRIGLAMFGAATAFFGAVEKIPGFMGKCGNFGPALAGRLDQHVDAAAGGDDLAPGLVVHRDAVLEALGAG